MIMTKITGAQSPMMTKKYTKFEKDSLKDSREKLRTNPDGRTDGRTDRAIPIYPPQLVGGGIIICLQDMYLGALKRTTQKTKDKS